MVLALDKVAKDQAIAGTEVCGSRGNGAAGPVGGFVAAESKGGERGGCGQVSAGALGSGVGEVRGRHYAISRGCKREGLSGRFQD